MKVRIFEDKNTLGQAAAVQAADLISKAIADHGRARILVATGESQFEFLDALVKQPRVDWKKVEMFHLDEYVGLSIHHPASFRRYLLDRFILKVGIPDFHLLDGESDPAGVTREVGKALASAPIDVAFVGIGENGHLAFNDPPADFNIETPYLIVQLDEACRSQQVGEGWFGRLDEVPLHAISISIRQLLKARVILAIVPDARKAVAVQRCLEGPVTPVAPASILREHPDVTLYLDHDSAGLLGSIGRSTGNSK